MHLNQLTIIGFTGSDAEVQYATAGPLVTALSVAMKESWKNVEGAWQSRAEWHRVVLFGRLDLGQQWLSVKFRTVREHRRDLCGV
jgi:single stranded DNA-binding protein